MKTPSTNLLLRLHKWAVRQDENFLTEAFAHLLQHLLEEEPEAAVRFLEQVTGGFFKLGPTDARQVALRTQIVLAEGRPDLEIRTASHLAFIEVKSDAEVDPDQLGRYRQLLSESGVPSQALILLTRYPAGALTGNQKPESCIRWHHVAEWLEQEAARYRFKPVSSYLVNQFLEFLRERNMVIEQVTWEMPSGLRALRSFTSMLSEAAAAAGIEAQPKGWSDYGGIKIGRNMKKPDYYAGVYFDRPEILVFETGWRKVSPQNAAELGIEGVYEWTTGGAGHGWRRELNLQSEETAFFVRSKARQMQLLEEFLRDCLATVKKIQVREETDQAPDGAQSPDDE
jgi:hypothetical protein